MPEVPIRRMGFSNGMGSQAQLVRPFEAPQMDIGFLRNSDPGILNFFRLYSITMLFHMAAVAFSLDKYLFWTVVRKYGDYYLKIAGDYVEPWKCGDKQD